MDRTLLFLGLAVLLGMAAPALAQETRETPRVFLPPILEGYEYEFGPGDVVQVQVWGNPDLTGQVMVGSSGRIQLPLIGEVQASGRTPEELSEDLTERYQLLDSSITEVLVSVAQYNSRSVTVLGEVRNAGVYGFQRIPDLWSVILTAGGPTPDAELSRVQIVREDPESEESRSILVDLSGGIDDTPADTLPALQPQDKVLVPSAEDVPVGRDKFQVIGAVGEPGVYRINLALDVVEAIAVSGGHSETANLEKVYLTRATANGPVSYELDVEGYLEKGDPAGNMPLQAGDTVLVPEKSSFWASLATGLGRLAPFASLVVTIILATN